uniref:Uncharacterized protein n=1 Tax=Anopheles merus TaxID=30066 RepID=A0A182UWZ0_ANOME
MPPSISISSRAQQQQQQECVKVGRGSMPPRINNSSNSVTVSKEGEAAPDAASQVGMGARWSCRPGYSFVLEKGESLCHPWFIFSPAATRSSSPTWSKATIAGQIKAQVHAASPPPQVIVADDDRARLKVMAGRKRGSRKASRSVRATASTEYTSIGRRVSPHWYSLSGISRVGSTPPDK